MNIINFLQPDKLPIDIIMIIIVLLSGLFQQKYLFNINMNGAWKTLIVSFIFCIIYVLLFSYAFGFKQELPLRWFFSYILSTSLYELLLKKFLKQYFPDE